MSLPLATDEPDDELFETSLRHEDNRVGIHNSRDDDDVESTRLMFRTEPLSKGEFSPMSIDFYKEDEKRWYSGRFRNLVLVVVCGMAFAFMAVLVSGIRGNSGRLPVKYRCPHNIAPANSAENYSPDMVDDYEKVSKSITTNMTEFLATFRDSDYDAWGTTYEQVKQGMKSFKSTFYPPYLQDGNSIYESACGIGLNLYMTLEILQESHGIEHLLAYGNEFIQVSAEKANAVFDHIAPAHSRKGVICPADSVHLGFVPPNSFDLVYTGYISPLLDPLNFGLVMTADFDPYMSLCQNASVELWAEATLNEIAQSRQNDWYGRWVAEMARIAKPGVPVIVEQVSQAYCDDFSDWGGVRKEWWKDMAAKNTYGWNVDPSSIVIAPDEVFPNRYHVFMLKNGKRENQ